MSRLWTIVSIWLVFASIIGASGFYSPSDDVVQLTADNFREYVLASNDVWVVEFYALWCSASQELVPAYRQAATALKGVVKVGGVNCEASEAEWQLCEWVTINSYPTILIFGGNKYTPVEYDGERTVNDIAQAALAELEKITDDPSGA